MMDGKTTRCWAIAEDPTVKQPLVGNTKSDTEGIGCPFQVSFDLPPTATANAMLNVTWTISFTMDSINKNKISYTLPLAASADLVTGVPFQIVHSNIHTCTYDDSNICDPFVDANKVRDHTINQPANFTTTLSSGQRAFAASLSFPAGDLAVLAHLALPGPADQGPMRYDFAVYRRIKVSAAAAPTATALPFPLPSTASPSTSTSTLGLVLGIGGGVLAVLAIAIVLVVLKRRRRQPPLPPPQAHYAMAPPYGYAPSTSVQTYDGANMDYSAGSSHKPHHTRSSGGGRPTASSNPSQHHHTSTANATRSHDNSHNGGGGGSANGTRSHGADNSSTGGGGGSTGSLLPGLSRDDEALLSLWRLDEKEVHVDHLLSRGAFGEVWLGEYRHTPVAIKKLLATRSSPDAVKTFVGEILLMSKLESRFIVRFIGVSWYRKAEMMLVLEYMNQGDLRTMLEQTTPETFPLEAKLTCALCVAEALGYLHTLDNSIIHRDVKSRNVLLDSHKGTKLTDFGVSREESSETMTIGIGTYRWMAPEILTDSYYTQAADIYSFGVILAELDTHLLPYSDQLSEKGKPLNDTAIMGRVMQGTIQPTFLQTCLSPLLQLAKECLSYDPERRPKALAVAYRMREIRKSVTGKRDSVFDAVDRSSTAQRHSGFV
ncbi:Aste57867_10845 [Aphanomyces stellatus]|uniref:Aste57867_10845 protein n=1 Tax=Aphanomyces stellatus TaxID=120398 RepID=A0A485KT26_9STRA|nr:hypothetical protein As57867_010805 [Aphanomyces stellatus]VFT87713.1 Aste57867_10845 [Aphanomyces stellatus]